MAGNIQTTNPGPTSGPGKRVTRQTTGKTKPEDDVSNTSSAYKTMLPRWKLMETVLAGTTAMRDAKELYLPKHEYETQANYDARINRTVFLNKTRDTVGSLVGKAFKIPPVLTEESAEHMLDFVDDVDGSGNNLAVFARQWFKMGLTKSFCHALVDYTQVTQPETPEGEERKRTKADDDRDNVRPFWSLITPENLIFATTHMVDGREVYNHVRILETETERVGYAEVEKQRIRVLEPGTFQLFELQDEGKNTEKWVKIDEGPWGPGHITLVTFYTDREGLLEGNSPLQDLAHLNVAHWQSSSDQRNVLTVARFPILALEGADATDDTTGADLVIGPNKWISTPAGSTVKFVEHTGAAIEAGRHDLQDLEDHMSSHAAEMLTRQPGNPTATARALDSSETLSPLQAMGTDFKGALEQLFEYTLDWKNCSDDECAIVFDVEHDEPTGDGKDMDLLMKLRQNRDISREGILSEAKRRDILDEDFDIEDDKENLDEETEELDLFNEENGEDEEDDDNPKGPPNKKPKKVKEPENVQN